MKNLFYASDYEVEKTAFNILLHKSKVGAGQEEIEKYLKRNKIRFTPRETFALVHFDSRRSFNYFKSKFSNFMKLAEKDCNF